MKKAVKTLLGASAAAAAIGSYAVLRIALDGIIGSEKPAYIPDGNGFMGRLDTSFEPYREIMREGTKKLHERKPEKVHIINRQGLRLCGHWIAAEEPKRTVVMMHGFRSSWDKDFSAAVDFFLAQGCNLLIVEQRARGESQGKYITYGLYERYDCIEWLRYADVRCGGSLPIYADGISMGATTVMLASELNMPSNVVGIIADCGFTSAAEILTHVIKKSYSLPEKPVLPMLSAICKRVAGFGFYDRSTVDALKNNSRPILFIHGEDDFFVPCEMSRRNYEAAVAPKEIITVPKAGHGLSYLVDRERCEDALTRLFDRCENRKSQ